VESTVNYVKSQVIENKMLNDRTHQEGAEIAGGKYEGMFHDVVENKWWTNVRFRSLHDVIEK